jgi:hypothetical protein
MPNNQNWLENTITAFMIRSIVYHLIGTKLSKSNREKVDIILLNAHMTMDEVNVQLLG